MLKIGITGNIGSGKSTVCRIFSFLGIPVYDADTKAKWLMNHDPHLMQSIRILLGDAAYTVEGLNTQFISQKVFRNPDLLESLNALVHPAVALDVMQWHDAQHAPYTIREAALLIEAKSYKQVDKLILVTAPQPLRAKRVKDRNNWSSAEIDDRMNNQMREEEKRRFADYIIANDGSSSVVKQVLNLHEKFLKISKSSS